jgi:DNA repair protein RadC
MGRATPTESRHFNHVTRLAELVAETADETKVIDMILEIASPNRNRTGLAAALISRFGNYPRVIAASVDELIEIDGVVHSDAFFLKLIQHTAQRALRPEQNVPLKLGHISDIMAYLQSVMRYEPVETFRIIFLNTKNYIIGNDVISEGTIDFVPIFRREIVRQALARGAAGLILVHNHPSGDPTPSEFDVRETQLLRQACDLFHIKIHDHLIVGNGSWSSLRALGFL